MMPRLPYARGQALTEFVVMALVLVPLFLLMPMIGKYQDISHSTEMASRYVAFEAIANNDGMNSYKPPAQLAQEVRRRFFSNSDAPIKTNDEAGDFKANQNLFWVDPQGNALIKQFNDVKVSFGPGHGADHADGKLAGNDGQPFNVPLPMAKEMDLKTGLYSANVSVVLANLQDIGPSYASTYDLFKNINLTVSRHTAVLPDTWTAGGPGQVVSRIDKTVLFPGRLLRPVKPVVNMANAVLEMPGPIKKSEIGELSFWQDEVPPDRLR